MKLVRKMRNGRANAAAQAVVCALIFGVCGARLVAQQGAPSEGLKTNPALALRDFEPAADEPYELGRGDVIAIDFGGHAELNSKQVVGPDGKITLPPAGSIKVADKTRDQAAEAIVMALSPFYARLSVTVGVEKYTSNQVLLLGAVEHPGPQSFDRPPTLLEVVTRGGSTGAQRGSAGGAGMYNVSATLQPSIGGVPERCAIYRGSDKVIWVNLKEMLDNGNSMADLRLKRDDIVYVPSGAERYVSVMGQVQHPGALQLESGMTLAKLLSLSGGLMPTAGANPQIQVIQPATGKTQVVSWKQVLQPGPMDLTLHSGDIVFVPESGFNKMSYVIEKLSPLVTMFTASALITR